MTASPAHPDEIDIDDYIASLSPEDQAAIKAQEGWAKTVLAFWQQGHEAGVRAERERCAKVCENQEGDGRDEFGAGRYHTAHMCADAIRKG